MFSAASKLGFTVAVGSIAAAVAYAFGIGDRDGFALLMFAGVVFALFAIGAFYSVGPTELSPDAADADVAPTPVRSGVPAASPWPIGVAGAVALIAVALAAGAWFLVAGVVALVAVGFVWFSQSWREHPSWTPAMTDRLNQRFVVPFGLPGLAIALVGLSAISVSRLLLAVSKDVAPVVATVMALTILVGCFYIASREQMGRAAMGFISVTAAVLVVASGIVGILAGEREIAAHGGEHGSEQPAGIELTAKDVAFDTSELTLPSGRVDVKFVNDDETAHNFALYTEEGGEEVFKGALFTGPGEISYEFEAPAPGTYWFQCDVHPADMNGTAVVAADASHGESTTTTAHS